MKCFFKIIIIFIFNFSITAETIDEKIIPNHFDLKKIYEDKGNILLKNFHSNSVTIIKKIETLSQADVLHLNLFKNSEDYKKYILKAENAFEEGKIIKEFYLSLSGFDGRENNIKYSNINFTYPRGEDNVLSIPSIMPINLEIRAILQYRIELEKLALKNGKDPKEYLQNAKIIFHVDGKNSIEFEKDLIDFNFFGFSNENIVIVFQPLLENKFKEEIENNISKQSTKYLGGHGFSFLQNFRNDPNCSYIISNQNERMYLNISPISYLKNKGAKYLFTAGVNDLSQLSADSLETDSLALAINEFEKGNDILLEMVKNPLNRVGAFWVKDSDGKHFVAHTHELLKISLGKQRPLEKIINNGAYYSRFVHYINLDTLDKKVENKILPITLHQDISSNCIRIQSFADDVCLENDINAGAFYKENKITNTFKSAEDIYKVIASFAEQDRNINFINLVKNIYLDRAEKHLSKPLVFHNNFIKTVWGGEKIIRMKNSFKPFENVGETWEISDQKKHPSYLIINGQLQPLSLNDL